MEETEGRLMIAENMSYNWSRFNVWSFVHIIFWYPKQKIYLPVGIFKAINRLYALCADSIFHDHPRSNVYQTELRYGTL